MKKSFYAYMSRLKHIKRWGLMRNTREENVAEHSFDVTVVAHALCIIKNELYGGSVSEADVVLAAVYHEAGEAITGDLPTPIKYFDDDIRAAYKKIERQAEETMANMLPEPVKQRVMPYILGEVDEDVRRVVKAADKICAYIKCIEEKKSGNTEFEKAEAHIRQTLAGLKMPEVDYFMEHFLPGYLLTLDELN
ncbi:MAG: 5'-deoxynucleotidase [Christensenellaceae bacterium]|jgi:5'-deoxynucleotidase